MKKAKDNHPKFSDEQIERFAGLALVLKNVHERLIMQGYTIRDGRIMPPQC